MIEEVSTEIERFFSNYKTRRYSKGQILLLNGEDTDYIYQLVRGKVKEYDVTYRGDEIILNIFKPPAFFPMSLAINKVPNPYIYEAETDIEIRQAPAGKAVEFIKANPEVMFDLLSRLYKGVDGLLGRMVQLMSGSAKSRLLYELLIECRRFGQKQTDGGCRLAISETDLATRAGLSRETVSRVIHQLKSRKLVTLKGAAIFIPDVKALKQELDIDD